VSDLIALLTDPTVEEVHVHGTRFVVVTGGGVSAERGSGEHADGLQALVERLAASGGGDE
jgi:hypothetical protein